MARSVKDPRLNTRTARTPLAARREPYWHVISAGCAIGYRKGAKSGTWIARFRDERGKQNYESIGAADDVRDADGTSCLSFSQAQEKARTFFARKGRGEEVLKGPYTVAMGLEDYFKARERRGSKGVKADIYAANARILPELGTIQIGRLTSKRIRDWHFSISEEPKFVRTRKLSPKQAVSHIDTTDADAVRARRSTANRVLTILKAALNYAFQEGKVASDEAWRKVKPFRGVDSAVVRYLKPSEAERLVNACAADFRNLVRGALLTGCRYGELTRLQVRDFDANAKTIVVRMTKSEKPRQIALNDEGEDLFRQLTAGQPLTARIFNREDGSKWGPSHQQRPLIEASLAASIDPSATFHTLRHSYASLLAMAGVPMGVIAAQLGHSDTRMTEKHYAHLAPSYVADTIRASLPKLGIVPETNIVRLELGTIKVHSLTSNPEKIPK